MRPLNGNLTGAGPELTFQSWSGRRIKQNGAFVDGGFAFIAFIALVMVGVK